METLDFEEQSAQLWARTVSCVLLDGVVWFQTDRGMRKARQMEENPLVALCVGNLQIEGRAAFHGHPLDERGDAFAELFQVHFPHAFRLYTARKGEVLVGVRPIRTVEWRYDGADKPFRLFLDMEGCAAWREFYQAEQEAAYAGHS